MKENIGRSSVGELIGILWLGSYVAVGWICYVFGKRAERRQQRDMEMWRNVASRIEAGENAGDVLADEAVKHGYKFEE